MAENFGQRNFIEVFRGGFRGTADLSRLSDELAKLDDSLKKRLPARAVSLDFLGEISPSRPSPLLSSGLQTASLLLPSAPPLFTENEALRWYASSGLVTVSPQSSLPNAPDVSGPLSPSSACSEATAVFSNNNAEELRCAHDGVVDTDAVCYGCLLAGQEDKAPGTAFRPMEPLESSIQIAETDNSTHGHRPWIEPPSSATDRPAARPARFDFRVSQSVLEDQKRARARLAVHDGYSGSQSGYCSDSDDSDLFTELSELSQVSNAS
jgi:hypothetical protein